MSAVRVTALALESVTTIVSGRFVAVTLTMHMTPEQRRAAVLELLGDIPEQEAFAFMRNEYPAWFNEVPA